MKLPNSASVKRPGGFTLIELLVVIGIIAILAGLLMPALNRGMVKAKAIECLNQLRETGIAMQLFAHEHHDRFPMQVPAREGGSMEADRELYVAVPTLSFSPRHFMAISNELSSPKLAHCPADRMHSLARTFSSMTRSNLSYWVNVRAEPGNPVQALAGDWNVSNPTGDSTVELAFTPALHLNRGNVLFADGHVELRKTVLIDRRGSETTRLEKPPRPAPGGFGGSAGNKIGKFASQAHPELNTAAAPLSRGSVDKGADAASNPSVNQFKKDSTDQRAAAEATGSAEKARNNAASSAIQNARIADLRLDSAAPGSQPLTNSTEWGRTSPPKARSSQVDEEIPLFATARTGAKFLLWIFLIVALAVLLDRYMRRRRMKKAMQSSNAEFMSKSK
jgi:prepilin-type N-terminal cleavage/methylation domain-containing protein/prepilin-type processing-associated H-X9-DG protein